MDSVSRVGFLHDLPLALFAHIRWCLIVTGVARGYFGQPELTARRFVIHSTLGRLYATGDVGRYLNNGEIEIIGRMDGQVKVGGNRVELAHVEHGIERHDGVKHAAVTLSPHGQLIAFLILKDGQPPLRDDELHAHVRDHLPDYMHPARWRTVSSLPLSANGKVDRRALKRMSKDDGPAMKGATITQVKEAR